MKEGFKMKVLYCLILTSLAIKKLNFMLMCFVVNQKDQQIQQNKKLIWYLMMKKKIVYKTTGKSSWVKKGQRSPWWDKFLTNEFPESEWRDNFHMSKRSFCELCDMLRLDYREKILI